MPLPWLTSQTAERSYSREWRSRDWVAWMRQILRFPFMVSSRTGRSRTDILEVDSMTTKDMAEFRAIGVHFACRLPSGDPVVLGGTLMEPIDCASPAGIAFAEYRAYRKEVGPPRGV